MAEAKGPGRPPLIVDSQVHIWAADTPDRPWPPGRAAQAQKPYPVTAEMLLAAMDEAGVDRVVLVPPSWEGDRNDVVLAAAAKYPGRLAAMGRLAIETPRPDLLPTWRDQPGMLGLRFTFHTPHHRPMLLDGTADWLWSAAEEAGLPIMLFVPWAVRELATVAERYRNLRLVLDHLAMWEGRDAAAFWELDEVLALARFPNVAVKASSLPSYSTEGYPFPALHPYIRKVYDAFGPRRMFWGTDWTRLPVPYSEAISLFTDELPWLTAEDLEWIMGRAVCEWLGWPLPAGSATG